MNKQPNLTFWERAFKRKSDTKEKRKNWSGRLSYLFASIGSVVGLGNIYTLPFLAYKFPGGWFIIVHIISVIVLGIPIFLLEIALGQKYNRGPTVAYSKINNRLTGLGVATAFNSFLVLSCYVVQISWLLVYAFYFFNPPSFFNEEEALDFFALDVLGSDTELTLPKIIPLKLLVCLIFVWILIYLCMIKGVKSLSNLFSFAVPTTFIISLIVMFMSFTVEKSFSGIKRYIGNWSDFNQLFNPKIWAASISQVFLSSGICIGIVTTYSSYAPKYLNATQDSVIILAFNSLCDLISCLTVFSILGNFKEEGLGFNESTLSFVAYPYALSNMRWPGFFGVIFFLSQTLIGLTSAVALLETIFVTFYDSDIIKVKISKTGIYLLIMTTSCLLGILLISDIGPYIVYCINALLWKFSLIIFGIIEVVSIGWFYRYDDVIERIGSRTFYMLFIGFFVSLLIGSVLCLCLKDYCFIGLIIFIIILSLTFLICFLTCPVKESGLRKARVIFLGSIELFREDINSIYIVDNKTTIPIIWSILIKWIVPAVLLSLLPFFVIELLEKRPLVAKVLSNAMIFSAILASFSFPLFLFYFIFPNFGNFWSKSSTPDTSLFPQAVESEEDESGLI